MGEQIPGVSELRVKETDRLRALAVDLRGLGVEVDEVDDGLDLQGTDPALVGAADPLDDARIAMVFGVLGAEPGNRI